MNFLRSKRLRWLGIGVAAVLIAAIAVKFLLPAEKIRDLALDQARTALGCDVSVGAVSVLLRGGLDVHLADFAIANPDDFEGAGFLTTKAIDFKLAL